MPIFSMEKKKNRAKKLDRSTDQVTSLRKYKEKSPHFLRFC